MEEIDSITITSEEADLRLDKLLANRFAGIKSRSYFEFLFEQQRVLLNGVPVKKRTCPKTGDEVQIHFILTPEMGLHPENIPLDILFEDEYIIAVNKPAGMVVHPAVGNWTGTFANALLYHCQTLPGDTLRPGIVHRLDKDTTGVLLAAKTAEAQQRLIKQFSQRKIYKEYLAICVGSPKDQTIDAPIGRHPVDRKRMAVVEGGKPAITYCKTIFQKNPLSVVSLILETGRTHQIRVHMQKIGTPVLGDQVYGSSSANARYKTERQLLHAYKVQFKHPFTQEEIQLAAPIPKDLQFFCS